MTIQLDNAPPEVLINVFDALAGARVKVWPIASVVPIIGTFRYIRDCDHPIRAVVDEEEGDKVIERVIAIRKIEVLANKEGS